MRENPEWKDERETAGQNKTDQWETLEEEWREQVKAKNGRKVESVRRHDFPFPPHRGRKRIRGGLVKW